MKIGNFIIRLGVFSAGFLLSLSLLSGCGQKESSSSEPSSSGKEESQAVTVDENKTASKSGFYFDTVITLTIYGTEDETPINNCFALAGECEQLFSNTIADSEISRINAVAGTGEYVTVSDSTLELIQDGIAYSELSDGAFDITIGTLSSLWNISEITESLPEDDHTTTSDVIPSEDEIAKALATVDYHAIEIDGNRVRLNTENAMIDLGGIAKGYIADQMKKSLLADGIQSAMINLGGNVLLVGSKPNGSDFRIGVQKPFDNQNNIFGVLQVSDNSVVTSGVYERYFVVNNVLYHHILDLTTGQPCRNGLYGVTIVSDSSMDGDALSTTCFVLGVEKGLELIESLDGIEAIYITEDLEVYSSSGINSDIPFTVVQ